MPQMEEAETSSENTEMKKVMGIEVGEFPVPIGIASPSLCVVRATLAAGRWGSWVTGLGVSECPRLQILSLQPREFN